MSRYAHVRRTITLMALLVTLALVASPALALPFEGTAPAADAGSAVDVWPGGRLLEGTGTSLGTTTAGPVDAAVGGSGIEVPIALVVTLALVALTAVAASYVAGTRRGSTAPAS